MAKDNRDDFTPKTKELLAKRAGYVCSNPMCKKSTQGPSEDPELAIYDGVAAHIHSAAGGGPRANADLTPVQRSSPSNGIHLCNSCSTIIDKNKGIGYSPEALIKWKMAAEQEARIRLYKSKPKVLYKEIMFDHLETNFKAALSCTGLNYRNVLSCPCDTEFSKRIEKLLMLANCCIIKGGSGSGKSLISYQVAYEYFRSGWRIFRLNKPNIDEWSVMSPPSDNSLIIIDDAQNVSAIFLENSLMDTNSNFKIISNWNSSALLDDELAKDYPVIEINTKQQINILKKYCLENRESITKNLQQLGLEISEARYWETYENRVEIASKSSTPWQFNYSLTEGWRMAGSDLDLLSNNRDQDLVLITVAIFDLATLDRGVKKADVLKYLSSYEHDNAWLQMSDGTINKFCLSEDGLIKNKHYEYSKKLLKTFDNKDHGSAKQDYVLNLLKKILTDRNYRGGHRNIIEFLNFDFTRAKRELSKNGFFSEMLSQKVKQSGHYDHIDINTIYSLVRVCTKKISNSLVPNTLVLKLIKECSPLEAMSLSNLINELYNYNYDLRLDKAHYICLISKLNKVTMKEFFWLSKLINRLFLFSEREELIKLEDELEGLEISISRSLESDPTAHFYFSDIISSLNYGFPKWCKNQVLDNAERIGGLFNTDFSKAIEGYSELINNYFHIISFILSNKNVEVINEYKLQAKAVLDNILLSSIVCGFKNIPMYMYSHFWNFLYFIKLYNKPLLKKISHQFQYDELLSSILKQGQLTHETNCIVQILYCTNNINFSTFIDEVATKVNNVNNVVLIFSPKIVIERLINNEVTYIQRLLTKEDFSRELKIIIHIEQQFNKNTVNALLVSNLKSLSESLKTKSDFSKAKYRFLHHVCINYPDVLKFATCNEDIAESLLANLRSLLRGKYGQKRLGRLYYYILKNFSKQFKPELLCVEHQFPSLKKYTL